MPRVKGSHVRARRDYVLRHHDEAMWQRVLQRLPEADRGLYDGAILASAWYPFGAANRLEEAIVAECGGDLGMCVDIGAFSGAENLSSVYRAYVAEGDDPVAFFSRLSQLYPNVYDFGSMRVEPTGPRELRVISDFAGHASRTNCLGALGFFRHAAHQAGIVSLHLEETSCQALSGARCVHRARW